MKLELNDVRTAAEKLGLDQKTGIEINIPQETVGNIPSINKKIEVTKAILKKYLENNLSIFIKEDVKKTKDEFKEDVANIVRMADDPEGWPRDKIIKYLENMGYDAEGYYDGQIASLADTIKFTYLNQANWDVTDMLNIVIGQGQNAYTPLQMNRVMSTISNGGYLNKFTLIDKISNHDSKEVLFQNVTESNKIDIKDTKHLEDIKYGAMLVAKDNAILNQLPIDIGVKTGTAEVEGKNADGSDYYPYAWMIGFAPYDDPEIAVSVILTQGNTSYHASPIMRDIIGKYFDLKVNTSNPDQSVQDMNNIEYGHNESQPKQTGQNPNGNVGNTQEADQEKISEGNQ